MNLFITATNTDVGKTYFSLYLIEKLSKEGLRVGVYKPIETGIRDLQNDNSDISKLLTQAKKFNECYKDYENKDISSYQFSLPSAPFVARKNIKISKEKLIKDCKRLQKSCDVLIIEGAGGLMTPIDEDFFMIDFIDLFKANTILVTSDKLGCINDTLLSQNALKQKNINFTTAINVRDDSNFYEISYEFLKTQENTYLLNDRKIIDFIKDNINV